MASSRSALLRVLRPALLAAALVFFALASKESSSVDLALLAARFFALALLPFPLGLALPALLVALGALDDALDDAFAFAFAFGLALLLATALGVVSRQVSASSSESRSSPEALACSSSLLLLLLSLMRGFFACFAFALGALGFGLLAGLLCFERLGAGD